MGASPAGTIVLVPFPFTDLSQTKVRPALAVAYAGRGDWVLCQITSNPYGDLQAVELVDSDFDRGSLSRTSFVRPGKLFTANDSLFVADLGLLHTTSLSTIIDAVIALLRGQS